jgi:hypothetical protein
VEIFWTVVVYAFVIGTLAVVAYGLVRMFDLDHHIEQH